jgi:hypothetical protein
MEPTLIGVTLISLALALSMSVVVWRLLREEQRRADARVAALVHLAQGPQREAEPADIQLAAPASEIAYRHDDGPAVATRAGLFEVADAPSPWGRRLGVVAGLALVLGGAVTAAIVAGPSSDAPAAAAVGPAPIELLSLRHARQGDAMTITGLVQNPRAGAPIQRIAAVAFLFDRDGTFIASGRAPLDFTALSPGDESPFVITVPAAERGARYRVGFRAADGSVLAHVDKRAEDAR